MNHKDKMQSFKREILLFERVIDKLDALYKNGGVMKAELHE